jgi:mitochondrial fission protein ELM1
MSDAHDARHERSPKACASKGAAPSFDLYLIEELGNGRALTHMTGRRLMAALPFKEGMQVLPVRERVPVIWVVTDGRAGIEAQALGLAEAMARLLPFAIETKRVALNVAGPRFAWGDPFRRLIEPSALAPPYPDIWIGCGRRAAALTVALRARAPDVFRIQLQNPRDRLSNYDLVIAPAHDDVAGDNVVAMIGAPNRIDRASVDALRDERLEQLPRPLVGVMIGGPNRAFRFGLGEAAALATKLSGVAAQLAISTSRRTPADASDLLRARLPRALFHDPVRDAPSGNLYPALLRYADAMIVTEDSVNMASEAARYGAPLYVAALQARPFANVRKFRRFHEQLKQAGASRQFEGSAAAFDVPPFDETARVAEVAIDRWRQRTTS